MKKVREKLNAKLRKSGGFTLVEMLIVVAIIAILIAVSIPLVSSSLEEARVAVDRANARSAVGLASIKVLSADPQNPIQDGKTWKYCIEGTNQGYLDDGTSGTAVVGQSKDYKTKTLIVTYHEAVGNTEAYFTTTFDKLLGSSTEDTVSP